MSILSREDEQRLWNKTVIRAPQLAVYVNDFTKDNSGHGRIESHFTVESIRIRRAPGGSECILSTPYQGLTSVNYNSFVSRYSGALFTVTVRFRTGRSKTHEKILFQGYITDFRRTVNESENSVQFFLNDFCFRMADIAVKIPTENLTGGQVISMLYGGYYNKNVWSESQDKYVTQTFWLYPDPWPRDKSGNRLVGIDKSLYWYFTYARPVKINGQPLIQALCDLCAQNKDFIPGIKYIDNRTSSVRALFTGFVRGKKQFDLVVGTVGKTDVTHVVPNDIKKFSGSISYQNTADRIIAEADVKKSFTTFELKRFWNDALETEYLTNPSIRGLRKYWRVARVWIAPKLMTSRMKAPEDSTIEYSSMSDDDITIQYRFSDNEEWKAYRGKFKITYHNILYTSGQNDNDDGEFDKAVDKNESGPAAFIILDQPLIFPRYTRDQVDSANSGSLGTGWLSDNMVIPQLQMQGIKIEDEGKPVLADTGRVKSKLPYTRTRYYESSGLTPMDAGFTYYYDGDDRAVETPFTPKLNSTTAQLILYTEARSIAQRMAEPVREDQVELSYLDFGLELGMEWMNLYDTELTLLEEIGKVFIEEISYEFGTQNVTTITFSQSLREVSSGVLIGA